jgi:hypothetical protein
MLVDGLDVEPQMPKNETEANATGVTKVEEGVKGKPTFHDLIITDFAKGIDFDVAPTVCQRFKFQVR